MLRAQSEMQREAARPAGRRTPGWSGARCGLWPVAAVLLITCGGGVALARQPIPLPLDEALSMYVSFDGTWINWAERKEQRAEIEAIVAAFRPRHRVSDDPEMWAEHQINLPPLPDGWLFFSPDGTKRMLLRVIVHDTQERLGQVIVTDRDTGAPIGALEANPAGSEIVGALQVAPLLEAYNLQVTARQGGGTVFLAGTNDPRVDQAFAYTLTYSWQPNRGHADCPKPSGEPYGDPRCLDGKVTAFNGGVMPSEGCAGPSEFENDGEYTFGIGATYSLKDKQLLRSPGIPSGFPHAAAEAVLAALADAKASYGGGTVVTLPFPAPPYSKGTVHWAVNLTGECKSVMYFPYRGSPELKPSFQVEIGARVNQHWGAGAGSAQPANEIVASVRQTWVAADNIRYQTLDPVAVGDVWGLLCQLLSPPDPYQLSGITAPVTFELWADRLPPAPGAPGRVGGSGTATRGEAHTDPAPPNPMIAYQTLEFPVGGDDTGLCEVELPKGWKWTATGRGAYQQYLTAYHQGSVGPFETPIAQVVRIETNLQRLLTLKIQTVSQHGNEPCDVQLEKEVAPDHWHPAAGGQTSEQQDGTQVWVYTGEPLAPGDYRVRAKSTQGMMSPWSDWDAFYVVAAIEHTRMLTVVRGDGPPPGGDPPPPGGDPPPPPPGP